MSVKYLKVKVKSLAEEARIIRKEEHKARKRRTWASVRQGREEQERIGYEEFWGLRHHRTGIVRTESRASLLAYAYIRGKKYSQVETKAKVFSIMTPNMKFHVVKEEFNPVLIPKIVKMVDKYGTEKIDNLKILNWITEDLNGSNEHGKETT